MAQPSVILPPETFVTQRLVLRCPRLSDTQDIFDNYASDPDVTRYMTWRPYQDRGEVELFLQSRIARWQSAEEYSWGITLTGTDRMIGMIACRIRGHAADIGYVLARQHWGRGYATEAAKAIVDWALKLPSVYRVWAVCDVQNGASARVLEKAGMQPEGVLRRYIVHPNISAEPRDCLVYAKVR